jgi:hypothetical protein
MWTGLIWLRVGISSMLVGIMFFIRPVVIIGAYAMDFVILW